MVPCALLVMRKTCNPALFNGRSFETDLNQSVDNFTIGNGLCGEFANGGSGLVTWVLALVLAKGGGEFLFLGDLTMHCKIFQ